MSETQKNNTVRKIVIRMVILFILAIGVLAFAGYRYVSNGLNPVDVGSDEIVEVEIPSGSTRRDIAIILEEKDLINSSLVFDFYVRFSDKSDFQAGTYKMSPSMTVEEIVDYLHEGGSPIVAAMITIPEGVHIEYIAELFEENSEYSKEEFLELVENPEFIERMVETYPDLLTDAQAEEDTRYTLEGYLFPASYDLREEVTLEDIVEEMIARMDQVLQPYLEDIQASDLNVHETLTLASHIEREGVTEEDRKLISGVFHNRLEEGMLLQTDPSVSYALGEHREFTTHDDLEIDSPYNTYMYPGVGVGPIASPSEAAIYASVYPAETDYMYFLADIQTGNIYYTETFEEHLELQEQYIGNDE